MRYSILAIMVILLASSAGAIETFILDLGTTGGAADETVTITRNSNDDMVFEDPNYGTGTLTTLGTNGATDHGALTGLTDDDHGSGNSAYYEWVRLQDKFGIEVSDVGTSTTTGTTWTKFINVSTDPAGNTLLGNHTTSTLIHYYRPGGVVVVSKTYTGRAGEYSSIGAALTAITDSASTKPYVVLIGPGTYDEAVTLSDEYVSLVGFDRELTIISQAGNVVNVQAANAGVIANLTLKSTTTNRYCLQPVGKVVCRNVKFESSQGYCVYRTSSAADDEFYDCLFDDVGADIDSYAVVYYDASGACNPFFWNCNFDVTVNDTTPIFRSSGAGTLWASFRNCTFQRTAAGGAGDGTFFLIDSSDNVFLYGCSFIGDSDIFDHNMTGGGISYGANDYFGFQWGSPTGGSSAPLTLLGAEFGGDVDIAEFNSLLMDGNTVIDYSRNATFNTVTATTGTFTNMVITSASLTEAAIDNLILTTEELSAATSLTSYQGATLFNQTATANVELPNPSTVTSGFLVGVYASNASGCSVVTYSDNTTIQGSATQFDLATSDSVTMYCDGTNWHILAHHIQPVSGGESVVVLTVNDFDAVANGATLSASGLSIGWSFPDNLERYVMTAFELPGNVDTTKDIIVTLEWYSPTTAQDCDWELAYRLLTDDEDCTDTDDTLQAYSASSGTANGYSHTDLTIPAAAIATTDEQLLLAIMRDGNDGSDDLDAIAMLIGAVVKYTPLAGSN